MIQPGAVGGAVECPGRARRWWVPLVSWGARRAVSGRARRAVCARRALLGCVRGGATSERLRILSETATSDRSHRILLKPTLAGWDSGWKSEAPKKSRPSSSFGRGACTFWGKVCCLGPRPWETARRLAATVRRSLKAQAEPQSSAPAARWAELPYGRARGASGRSGRSGRAVPDEARQVRAPPSLPPIAFHSPPGRAMRALNPTKRPLR